LNKTGMGFTRVARVEAQAYQLSLSPVINWN